VEAGVAPEQVHIVEDGTVLALGEQGASRDGKVPAGRTLIDRCGGEEIEELVVRDRRHLSSDGIVVPVIVVEKESGRISSMPEIVTRGLVDGSGSSALVEDAGRLVIEALEARTPEEHQDPGLTRERVRLALTRFIKKRTQRRPLVVPVIMEV
jgi:ribonuclease J